MVTALNRVTLGVILSFRLIFNEVASKARSIFELVKSKAKTVAGGSAERRGLCVECFILLELLQQL